MNEVTGRDWRLTKQGRRLAGILGGRKIKIRSYRSEADLVALARTIFNFPATYTTVREILNLIGQNGVKKTGGRKRRSGGRNILETRIRNFYDSWEWKKLRYETLLERGPRCELCGASRDDGVRIVVDHIRPVRSNWHLRLDKNNLQVACNDCNMGKGSHDETRWHKE